MRLTRTPLLRYVDRLLVRSFSSKKPDAAPLVLASHHNGVAVLTLNAPAKLNAWTAGMLFALRAELDRAAVAPGVGAVVLTGAGAYYCAGVSLADTLKPMHPRALRAHLVEMNYRLFDTFLSFPKPILVAANGPAIGASVTSKAPTPF